MAEPQLPFDLFGQQQSIDRKRQLAQMLMTSAQNAPQGQMVSGHFVSPGILGAILPLVQAFASQKIGSAADTAQQQVAGQYKNELAGQLQKYFETTNGKPGQTLSDAQAANLMQNDQAPPPLAEPVQPDPRKAMIEALTSQMPEMKQLGQLGLSSSLKQEQTPETFGHSPVTERDPVTQKLISVLYGNRGTRRIVSDSLPYEKPMVAGDVVFDPTQPNKPLADYGVKGGEIRRDANGDVYQVLSNGQWKKLDNAPKVSVGGPTVINKGEDAFSAALGKDVAGDYKAARDAASQGYKVKSTVAQLRELDSKGTFSGPTANIATSLAAFGQTLGLPVDQGKLANSEAYQQQFAKQVSNVLMSGSGVGRSMTDEDRKAFERSLPSMLATPQGRQQIFKMMEAEADNAIRRHQSFQTQLRNNPLYKNSTGLLALDPVENSGGFGVTPPGAQTVPGSTAKGGVMTLDEYLNSRRK